MRSTYMNDIIMSNDEFIKSRNQDLFYYNEQTKQWVRVLCRSGNEYKVQIEVLLTPINPHIQSEWDYIGNCIIKTHKEKTNYFNYTGYLPQTVYEDMLKHLNNETVDNLIHADLLRSVDLRKLYDGTNLGEKTIRSVYNQSISLLPLDLRIRSNPNYWDMDLETTRVIRNIQKENIKRSLCS